MLNVKIVEREIKKKTIYFLYKKKVKVLYLTNMREREKKIVWGSKKTCLYF